MEPSSSPSPTEIIARWYALCGLVENGLDEEVALDLVKLTGSTRDHILRGTTVDKVHLRNLLLAARDRGLGQKTERPLAVLSILAEAARGNPDALRWLVFYLERTSRTDPIPTLDERIAQVQALRASASSVKDLLLIDQYTAALVEERRLAKLPNAEKTIDELTSIAVAELEKVMSSPTASERRKAAVALLNHAVNLTKAANATDMLLSTVVPMIQRFSEDLIRITERRVPEAERAAWRGEAQELLQQLVTSMGTAND